MILLVVVWRSVRCRLSWLCLVLCSCCESIVGRMLATVCCSLCSCVRCLVVVRLKCGCWCMLMCDVLCLLFLVKVIVLSLFSLLGLGVLVLFVFFGTMVSCGMVLWNHVANIVSKSGRLSAREMRVMRAI